MIRFLAFYHKGCGKKKADAETAAELSPVADVLPAEPQAPVAPTANAPQNPDNAPMAEKEILEDLLVSQEQIAALYNTAALECTDSNLKNDMLTVLREAHELHGKVAKELTARGFLKSPMASQSKIDEAKREFSQQNEQ